MNYLSTTLCASLLAIATSALAAERAPEAIARIDASSKPRPGEPSLAKVRRATERFHNVKTALAEGYIRDPENMCLTAEMIGKPKAMGAMGVHYFRPDLLGVTAPLNPRVNGNGTHTSFANPAVLVYEPQKDGSLKLVAVENLVFVKAWKAKHGEDLPKFHGLAYDLMADDPTTAVDEAHHFEPHYDRHVWLYRRNPNGIFAQFNPRVSCEYRTGGHG